MQEPEIRPATDADSEAVIEIFNHYATTGFAAFPDKPVAASFIRVIGEGAHSFYVLSVNGEIPGFAILRPLLPFRTFARTATVTTFIAPAHRHQGYGTLLLEAMTREAKKRGIAILLASVSSRNNESIGFHKKHGFIECGRMYGVGEKFNELFDLIWLQKDLAPRRATLKPATVPSNG